MRNPSRRRLALSLGVVVALSAGGSLLGLSLAHQSSRGRALLSSASCSGPNGAAYVAEAGYQAFGAIDTANCTVVQTYNVGDTNVPGDPDDTNYAGTDEGVALSHGILWFAVTGTSDVARIDTADLNPSNYSPAERLIPVGFFPDALAVSPDGSTLWVADTGPQTLGSSRLSGVSVIDAKTDTVTARLALYGSPTSVAFSPNGTTVYVTTSRGLYSFDASTRRMTGHVGCVGDPESVTVSPDGTHLYVTESEAGRLATFDASTLKVVRTTPVGELPWAAVVSHTGSRVYVANPDSDSVSVVDAASGAVVATVRVKGDPDALALTPDGSQLWVGEQAGGSLAVINTASDAVVSEVDLGGPVPQSGDGLEPTGIVLTSTPTPGS